MDRRTVEDVLVDLNTIINKNFKGATMIDEINHKTGKSYGIKEGLMSILCDEIEKILNDGDFVCTTEDIKLCTPCSFEKVIIISITKKVIKKTELAIDKTLLNRQEIVNIEFNIDSEYDEYLELTLDDFKSTIKKLLVSKKVTEMEKRIRDMEIEKQRLLSLM